MRQRRLRMNQAFPAPGVPRLQPHRPSERTPASLIWVPCLFACRIMHHAHLSSCPAARLAQLLRTPHGLPQSLAPLRSFPACCNPNLAEEVIMCSLCQPVECIEWAAPASSYQVPSVRCACTQCLRSGVDQAPPTHCTQMLQCWQSGLSVSRARWAEAEIVTSAAACLVPRPVVSVSTHCSAPSPELVSLLQHRQRASDTVPCASGSGHGQSQRMPCKPCGSVEFGSHHSQRPARPAFAQ